MLGKKRRCRRPHRPSPAWLCPGRDCSLEYAQVPQLWEQMLRPGEHSRSCKTSRAWPKAVGKSPHSLGEPKFHGFQHFAALSQGLVPLGFEEPTGSTTDSLCLKWALSFPACPTGRTAGKSSMLCSMSQDGPQGRPQGLLGGHGICPIHPYTDLCCHLKLIFLHKCQRDTWAKCAIPKE